MKLLLFCIALAMSAAYISGNPGPNTTTRAEGNAPLDKLVQGNERFASGAPTHFHETLERRGEIAKGQHPFAVVVGCSDSRVPPELVFDQGLGDLFVVRTAGEVLGDGALGSIEYAVEHLGCELVVVLGHERCGAVGAVVQGGELPGHLSSFTPAILPVIAEAKKKGGDVLDNAVRAHAQRVVRQLAECEPILSEYVHLGKLQIVGARYDLDTGVVEFFEPSKNARATGREIQPHGAARPAH